MKNLFHISRFFKIRQVKKQPYLLTTVGHLKEVILLELLKHAPFDLNKLQQVKTRPMKMSDTEQITFIK